MRKDEWDLAKFALSCLSLSAGLLGFIWLFALNWKIAGAMSLILWANNYLRSETTNAKG